MSNITLYDLKRLQNNIRNSKDPISDSDSILETLSEMILDVKKKRQKQKLIKLLSKLDKDISERIIKHCRDIRQAPEAWILNTLNKELRENASIVIENKGQEELIRELVEKYSDHKTPISCLYKTDTYVNASNIEFAGHSVADAKPIYKIKDELHKKEIANIVKMKPVKKGELTKSIPVDSDADVTLLDIKKFSESDNTDQIL